MKVNMQMATDFDDKIDKIREKHYKGATKSDYRASFLCNQIIDSYGISDEDKLKAKIEGDANLPKAPRTLTFRVGSHARLLDIAKSLNVTPATALRGLIELNADCEEAESDMQEEAGPSPDVELKLRTIKEKIKELQDLVEELEKDIRK